MQALRDVLREELWNTQLMGEARHPGLLLQRYLKDQETSEGGESRARKELLEKALEISNGHRDFYKNIYTAWEASFSVPGKGFSGKKGIGKVQGRAIVGLGSHNVLEAGIALHPLYGVPYIPGSALKGLAAHYCHTVWGSWNEAFQEPLEIKKESKDSKEEKEASLQDENTPGRGDFYRVLFGTTDEAGIVVFHDALISQASLQPRRGGLLEDVLTPHHKAYYGGENAAPSDFDDPVPITFLSMTGDFCFVLTSNGEDTEGEARAWVDVAFQILTEALRDWGIGGKTSSGYGRIELTPIKVERDNGDDPKDEDASGFAPGAEILVTRLPDRVKKKGKVQKVFEAPDGVLCLIHGTAPPEDQIVPEGETRKAKIVLIESSPEKRYMIELL
jgi:CRISPR-associated protein Cmr6